MKTYLLVNFGGPRDLSEISSFLTTLLLDRDVIRTSFPTFIHNWFFKRVAKKRSHKLREDYQEIGGRSPIYFDTEKTREFLEEKLQAPVYTFHRYLPATHEKTLEQLKKMGDIVVIPLFPQFSYATTGSIARFLASQGISNLQWIKSYATHPAFIASYQRRIKEFLKEKGLEEKETLLLFSAHGLPQKFVDEGDRYEEECKTSFQEVMKGFPKALGKLCYQSKFGRGEWLKPYTDEVSDSILNWHEGRKNIVFVPISFTSDHIETLFEIEKLYVSKVQKKGLNAYRCPALNLEPYWMEALSQITQDSMLYPSKQLIRLS